MATREKIIKWLAILLLVLSAICLSISAGSYFYLHNRYKTYLPAQGTVVELVRRDGKRTYYSPVIDFKDAGGADRKFYSSVGSYPPSHHVGDSVALIYDPANPNKAAIDGFFYKWLLPAATGAIGAIYLLLGIAGLVFLKISRARRARMDHAGDGIPGPSA